MQFFGVYEDDQFLYRTIINLNYKREEFKWRGFTGKEKTGKTISMKIKYVFSA